MRGFTGSGVVPTTMRCTRCKARYRQHSDGLCRSCHRGYQLSDPVQVAAGVLKHFIGRHSNNAIASLDGLPLREAQTQNREAMNALDLILAELKGQRAQ